MVNSKEGKRKGKREKYNLCVAEGDLCQKKSKTRIAMKGSKKLFSLTRPKSVAIVALKRP
ncbi:MAG: hypothetical protein KKI12_12040 [Proteobacteria bacterium]|nr:hypothetical protein [Pseudomonadota bacterium]